ncbi:MAG: hypothetical protein M0R46_15980 [Candidatus Muirbacterium halophilum]|nr:hypothetical protein [Candidatus Muirbacterium halophilum]MCK9477415.1 hypothetical protein [Candidatus Muirbacterium halophilum]
MGRTLLSATMLVNSEKDNWSEFRRALRKEDKEIFDRLFAMAKVHSQAISNSNAPYPLEAILFSILIEQYKEIQQFKKGNSNENLFD